jgi:hypothetical protein
LTGQRAKLEKSLDKVEDSTEETWDDIKDGARNTFNDVKVEVQKLADKIDSSLSKKSSL